MLRNTYSGDFEPGSADKHTAAFADQTKDVEAPFWAVLTDAIEFGQSASLPNIGTLAFFGGVGWYNVLGAAGARQHERPYRRTLLMALLLELASCDEANIGGVADGVEVLAVDEGWASVELPSEIPIHSSLGTRDPLTIELSHKPALDGSGSDGEATTSHSDPASMSTVAARGLLFFPFAFSAKPSSELYTESFRSGFIPMSDGEFWHSITRALVLRNQTSA
jgi:hypothetical protein